MRYAIIENNIIINILDINNENEIPQDYKAIKIPDELMVNIGDFYINDKFQSNLSDSDKIRFLLTLFLNQSKQIKELSQRIFQLESFYIK